MVRACTSGQRQRGGVLLAVAGMLVIIALASFAVFALRTTERKLGKNAGQQADLEKINSAMAQFVARHRRLPCPARGTLANGSVLAGKESITPATGQCFPTNQEDGVVPWIDLGLTEPDARDAWNGRISYRVQPSLANPLLTLLDMSWCDPAGATDGATGPANACRPAPCTSATCMHPNNYFYGKGLQVQDGAGGWLKRPMPPWSGAPTAPPLANGAAYVLISHGANGAGAYSADGALQNTVAPGASESANANGLPLNGASVFIDQPHVATPGPAYFDDALSHPTLHSLLGKAALGARSH